MSGEESARPRLPRGFGLAAGWLALSLLFAVWPLSRAFSGYTGVMIDAPAYVLVTAAGLFTGLLLVYISLLRLRPAGIWLSIALAAIFSASSILRLPGLVATGAGPAPLIWVLGVTAMLNAATAVYFSRPSVLQALERRRGGRES
jgi:hypothetical protein